MIGTFQKSTEVYLGEITTDEEGRLIVLGGKGLSRCLDESQTITNDFDTPNWFVNFMTTLKEGTMTPLTGMSQLM